MQNQPTPGNAVGDYAGSAVATRSESPLGGLWKKLKMGATAALFLFAAGFGGLSYFKSQKNVVLFENSLDKPGELSLNGKSYGSLEPHKHIRLELDAASYTVSFNGGGAKLDEGTLEVPKGKGGFGTVGYRAIYNIGGKKGLGVITKYYGGSNKDNIRLVEEGKRVVEVPNVELTKIDEGFPDSITVPKGQSYGSVVRVCHVDEEKQTVSCPGW
jgi:hypothetical protein